MSGKTADRHAAIACLIRESATECEMIDVDYSDANLCQAIGASLYRRGSGRSKASIGRSQVRARDAALTPL